MAVRNRSAIKKMGERRKKEREGEKERTVVKGREGRRGKEEKERGGESGG